MPDAELAIGGMASSVLRLLTGPSVAIPREASDTDARSRASRPVRQNVHGADR